MKRFFLILLALSLYTGCTTMPAPVQEKYLAEKTTEESAKIQQIEQQIIAKNQEKQQSEKVARESAPGTDTIKEEIKLLNKEKEVLTDQLELYKRSKDAVNIEQKKKQIAETDSKLKKKKAILQFQTAKSNYQSADNELKKAQLALLISELNYEKSKVAEAYRERNEPDTGKKKSGIMSFFKKTDPDDRFEYKKYRTYFEKIKKELLDAEKNFKESEKKYESSKKTLEAIK